MQITLKIPDKKADAFLDVLRHISYVKIKPSTVSKSQPADDSTEEFYEGLKRAVHDVNEAIAGRKKTRPIEELIAEMRSENV